MSPRRYFGTDGIRGRAGEPPLTPGTIARLGRALAQAYPGVAVIGRDTRRSSPALRDALSAGLLADGAAVVDLGVLPTPAVPNEVLRRGAALGVAITASHNPFRDNGIKVFGPRGDKLDDAAEGHLEDALEQVDVDAPGTPGRWTRDAAGARTAYLAGLRPDAPFADGLRVIVDAAHGAASSLAVEALAASGAVVIGTCCAPDGDNINEGCGALHPGPTRARVLDGEAQLGVLLDGDADRCLLIDEQGGLVDGDVVMALLAIDRGHDAIVGTVMSNQGVVDHLARAGVVMHRAPVGDRNVLARMREVGASLGGEESGHVIQLERGPAGDGLATALAVLEVVARSGRTLASLAAEVPRYPAAKRAVRVREKPPLAELPSLQQVIADAEATLPGGGRTLVRYSGTEPVLRILVEGPDADAVETRCEAIATAAARLIGTSEDG